MGASRTTFSPVGWAAFAALVLACGGAPGDRTEGASKPPPASAYAGSAGDSFARLPGGPYPAAHAALPLVAYNGGDILTAPKIVTVTFEGDTMDPLVEVFGRTIGSTHWWDEVRTGYCTPATGECVGHATQTAHVVLPALTQFETEAGFNDAIIADNTPMKRWLRDELAQGALPLPDDQTLYMVFFPANVELTTEEGGLSCVRGGFAGYHNTFTFDAPDGSGTLRVPYAAIPRCNDDLGFLTRAASHELIEAATDPDVLTPGFALEDPLWDIIAGGEVGDLCVDPDNKSDTIAESGLVLQRSWSNVAVQAGKNPCVPVPAGEVYFNTAPKVQTVTLGAGESVRIALQAFSDGPGDDWDLEAIDLASTALGDTPYLKFDLDRTTVNNGEAAFLTVTSLKAAPRSFGVPFLIVSRSPTHTHVWPAHVLGK